LVLSVIGEVSKAFSFEPAGSSQRVAFDFGFGASVDDADNRAHFRQVQLDGITGEFTGIADDTVVDGVGLVGDNGGGSLPAFSPTGGLAGLSFVVVVCKSG